MADDDSFVPLTHEILSQSLSQIELHVAGGGFAFTRLDCSNKEPALTNLGNKVENYKHLRHVVLSNNKLDSLTAVQQLPHLLTLHADNNAVTSLDCQDAKLPWCQRLDLSGNKLVALPPLQMLGRLRFARFTGNQIASLEGFSGHPALEELDLQENQLTTLRGLGTMVSLRRLSVAGNQLASLEGLDAPRLSELELSKNQLASLANIEGAPSVIDLDIRDNQLSAEDPMLPELRRLYEATPELRTLKLSGNPLADGFGDSLKIEVLVCAPQLLVVEEEPVTDEDRQAATERGREILAERAAKEAAEAEAAAAAAAEAKAAAEEEAAAAAAAEAGEDGGS